jgi:hypothetical protein
VGLAAGPRRVSARKPIPTRSPSGELVCGEYLENLKYTQLHDKWVRSSGLRLIIRFSALVEVNLTVYNLADIAVSPSSGNQGLARKRAVIIQPRVVTINAK